MGPYRLPPTPLSADALLRKAALVEHILDPETPEKLFPRGRAYALRVLLGQMLDMLPPEEGPPLASP